MVLHVIPYWCNPLSPVGLVVICPDIHGLSSICSTLCHLRGKTGPTPCFPGGRRCSWWAGAIPFYLTLLPQWLKKTGPSQSTYVPRAKQGQTVFCDQGREIALHPLHIKETADSKSCWQPFCHKEERWSQERFTYKDRKNWSLVMSLSHWIKMIPQPALRQDFLVTQVISLLLKE